MISSHCISFSLLLATWSIPDVIFPPLTLDVLGGVNISSLRCRGVDIGVVRADYNSTNVAVSMRGPSVANCSASVSYLASGNMSTLHLGLAVPPGAIRVETSSSSAFNTTACLTETAVATQCSLVPKLDSAYLLPMTLENLELDFLLFPLLEALLNGLAPVLVCDVVVQDLVSQLTNHTLVPPVPLPPQSNASGAADIDTFALFNTLINAANGIPTIVGVRLAAKQLPRPNGNALQLNMTFPNGLDEHYSAADSVTLRVPEGVVITSEVVLEGLTCTDQAHCWLNPCGVDVMNVRMLGGSGAVDRFVTNVAGIVMSDVLHWVVDPRHLPPSSTACRNATVELRAPSKPVNKFMDPLAGALVGAGLAILATWALHEYSKESSKKGFSSRRTTEDRLLIVLCFVCAYAFIWASTSTSAEVVLGNDIVLYSFTLSIIHDLWVAGLKALSLLVTITSGVIPYIKLFATMYTGIIQNRPKARFVVIMDVIGKFTYLDRFALMITMTRLHVEGVADVTLLPSFYVFLFAIVLSTGLTNRVIMRSATIATPKYGQLWGWKQRWMISLVSGACCVSCCILRCVRYDIGGVLNVITGPELYYSAMALFNAAPPFLFGTAFFTVLIAPMLLSLTFPLTPMMLSWCATDTFLIACVAGLTQLENFIAFIISDPTLNSMYTASAVLLWPLALLAIATCIQWFLLGVYLIRERNFAGAEAAEVEGFAKSGDVSIATLQGV